MKIYTCYEIASLIDGSILYWQNEKIVEAFSNYPGPPLPYALYFIRGPIPNEDNLISKLNIKRTSGIIIDKNYPLDLAKFSSKGIGVILVSNMQKAYFDLVSYHRMQFKIPFIQVLGSSGKSTIKEMVASILKVKIDTLVSYKNYNSPYGVAFNLFRLNDKHQAGILETGMRAKGIIAKSTKMIQPNFVIVSCIHRAHLAKMGSMEEIIAAKSEFIDFLSPESVVIINGNDENCKRLPLQTHKGKVMTFGFSESCDIWAKDIEYGDFQMHFKACTNNVEFYCTINTFGSYNVLNALSAILLGLCLGFSTQEIQEGLSQFHPLEGRLQVIKCKKDSLLINDTFNANPDSTAMLIDEIQHFPKGKPVFLVIGDFENPNSNDPDYPRTVHYEVGKRASNAMLYKLIAIGNWADAIISGATENGFPAADAISFTKTEDAIDFLDKCLITGSIVLFKSSPHVNLSKLIMALQEED